MTEWFFLAVYLGGVGLVLALLTGLGRDVLARSALDLKNRRDARICLEAEEALPKQVALVAQKERAATEVVRTMRAGDPDEKSEAYVKPRLLRIDAIDQEAERIRARVKARREEIEEEFAELIEERRATARTMVVWRCATLVCAVAGAVLLGVGLV
ncbi:hypothetical protein J0910_18980 [Nocardiopsis sp. CNT-189]|uniref:hypothetical protein n=1 Tax=Nocardiopsis oceanisediminis TaxID=2816862 RepID=UPI003B30E2D0